MKSKLVLAATLLLIFSSPGNAAECMGVTYPEDAAVGETKLTLNGLGLREATAMKIDVYVAALYLEDRSSSGDTILNSVTPKKLTLTFLRNVSKRQISSAWSKGLKKIAGGNLENLEDRISKLNGWMADLTEGSTLTFTYRPQADADADLEIEVNGERRGAIPGNDFAKTFLGIWLGPKPVVNKGLKSGLLGGSCN